MKSTVPLNWMVKTALQKRAILTMSTDIRSFAMVDTPFLCRNAADRIGADVSKYIVSVRDDGDPALTFRSIVLGSAFTALSSVITMLYTFKPIQMQVSAVFLQRMF